MKFNPKVSIVIPVYNGSNYLKEAIDSALSQTYENTEVIVINDGSNDNNKTDKICKSYGNKIRYFKKENGGVASALNMGIEKMKGEYFSWLSHDDVYYPEKVEKQIQYLSRLENNSNIVLYANYELIDKDSNFIKRVELNHEELLEKPEYALLRGCINGITLLIPKSAFEKYGKFDESLKVTQDYDMWRRIIKTYEFVHMDEIYTKTRIHSKQDSNKHPDIWKEGDKLWIKMMKETPLEIKERLEGSEYNFYYEMVDFLKRGTPYIGARTFATEQMEGIYQKTIGTLKDIKVSIIIPFFNRIPLLITCVESVESQTHRDIEILLINDCSTDDVTGLEKHIKRDARIRLISINKNKGPAYARNVGIDKATGEYIAFLDSDDEFLPEKIEEQLLEMYLSNYNVGHTSYIRRGEGREEVINIGKLTGTVIPEIIHSCKIATPTVMIKTKYLKKNGFKFREDIKIGEDTCFWLEVLRNTKLLGIDKALTIVNANSKSAAFDSEKHLEGLTNVLGYLLTDTEYSRYHKEISNLYRRYVEVSKDVTIKEESKNLEGRERVFQNKLEKLFYLFKYQGVILTTKKIIWKYGPRIFNKKDKYE